MHFLQEITIIATVSVLVTIVLGRLKLPVIAGLVLSGALVGPNGLSIAQDSEAIEVIAEVGVVFLLFTIGLEFSLSKLRHIFRQVALGGLLQVSVTAAITTGIPLDWMVSCRINHLWLRLCLIEHRSCFTDAQRKTNSMLRMVDSSWERLFFRTFASFPWF